jgi:hypothetical protein
MKKTPVARVSPRVVAIPHAEPHTQEPTIKQNMRLYKSPRVAMVEQFLQQYGEKRPIPVEDMLPVTLMNYGQVEFQKAQIWFEEGEEAPGHNDSPSLVDVGAGFGPAVPSAQAGAHPPRPVMTPLPSSPARRRRCPHVGKLPARWRRSLGTLVGRAPLRGHGVPHAGHRPCPARLAPGRRGWSAPGIRLARS